jgi:uncharacterized protein YndB with AHSA1/START domain
MPTTRRQRLLDAPTATVWEVVSDAHHMPRWWPGVARVEGVEGENFTEVHMTKKGRGIRIDFVVLDSRAPDGEQPGVRRWEQEVIGTPFERVLNSSVTELELTPDGAGTRVTLALVQSLRGSSKFGGIQLRRANGRRLDEALENLARIF